MIGATWRRRIVTPPQLPPKDGYDTSENLNYNIGLQNTE
jgi:hypothetical protein